MAKKQGLGRGLGSLISETSVEAHSVDVKNETSDKADQVLPLSKIHRNENQPRTNFDEGELEELTQSIQQVGVLQPILVRPDENGYEIVAGERRYLASKRAGLKEIPVIIREIDDEQLSELALIENIQRSDLNPIEEAQAMQKILETTKITQEELAQRLSKSRSSIANTLRLLDLSEDLRSYVADGDLTAGHARALLSVPNKEQREKLAQTVMVRHLSVRQTEELAKRLVEKKSQQDSEVKKSVPESFGKATQDLKRILNTDVRIKTTSSGKNKLEITIKDEAQFKEIVEALSKIPGEVISNE